MDEAHPLGVEALELAVPPQVLKDAENPARGLDRVGAGRKPDELAPVPDLELVAPERDGDFHGLDLLNKRNRFGQRHAL